MKQSPLLYNPREAILRVAESQLGLRETSTNRAPGLQKFWDDTSYQEGMADREPWCSAFATWCVREADKQEKLINFLVPPTFPAVAQWLPWAARADVGAIIFKKESEYYSPLPGDIVVYAPAFSHVGIVKAFTDDSHYPLVTIEGNTNEAGSREGDGIYEKHRALDDRYSFIRLPAMATV